MACLGTAAGGYFRNQKYFDILLRSASCNRRHWGYIFSYFFTIEIHCSIWPYNKSILWINQISLSSSHMIKVFDGFLWRYFHNSTKSFRCEKKYVISYLTLVGRQIGIQIQKEKKIKERKQTEILVIIERLMKSVIREHKKRTFLHKHMTKMENVRFFTTGKAYTPCLHSLKRYQAMVLAHLFKIKHSSLGTCSLSQEKCAQHIWYLTLHATH